MSAPAFQVDCFNPLLIGAILPTEEEIQFGDPRTQMFQSASNRGNPSYLAPEGKQEFAKLVFQSPSNRGNPSYDWLQWMADSFRWRFQSPSNRGNPSYLFQINRASQICRGLSRFNPLLIGAILPTQWLTGHSQGDGARVSNPEPAFQSPSNRGNPSYPSVCKYRRSRCFGL